MGSITSQKNKAETGQEKEKEDQEEVAKLCQGRLSNMSKASDHNNRSQSMISDHFTVTSNHTLETNPSTNGKTTVAGQNATATPRLFSTRERGALLFVDISGFTRLSQSLEVESLSKVSLVSFSLSVLFGEMKQPILSSTRSKTLMVLPS